MTQDKSTGHSSPWYGTAWLVGQAGLEPTEDKDGRFHWPSALTPGFDITIGNPEKLYNDEDGHIVRHCLDFTCRPVGMSLRHVAEQALEQIADLLSFTALSPVRMYLEPFSASPPPAPGHAYSAVAFEELRERPLALRTPLVAPSALVSALQRPAMSEPHARKMILHALRWQRRAMLAVEPVVRFAHYAFALEAIAPCMPATKGNDQSARLRSFATGTAGLSEGVWRRVGRLRHALFHGGIDETSDTVQDAAWCSQVASYALVIALRKVLALDTGAPPEVPVLCLGQMRDGSLSGDGLVRPHPPERLW
jgi:hypothetical protein